MTIKRTTNWSEEGALHVEVTEDPIEQTHRYNTEQLTVGTILQVCMYGTIYGTHRH
jgi:hypothetical protein